MDMSLNIIHTLSINILSTFLKKCIVYFDYK